MCKYILAIVSLFFVTTLGSAQNPFISESLIKYDLGTHKTDKAIPFDRSFTLVLEKFKLFNVTDVHIYESHMVNGNRFLVENIYLTKPGVDDGCCKVYKGSPKANTTKDRLNTAAIKDRILRFKADTSSLMIFVDPLKPNKFFDINVIGHLSQANKTLAYQINSFMAPSGDLAKAKAAFNKLNNALIDPFLSRSYLTLSYADYEAFYKSDLKSAYDFISNSANFPVAGFLNLNELQAIDISSNREKQNYKDAHYLVEIIQNSYGDDIQRGLIDILKVYDKKEKSELSFGHIRMPYLQSSLKILDSLHRRMDWLIGKGYYEVTVNNSTIMMEDVRQKIKNLREEMGENLRLLTERMNTVTEAIDKKTAIRQGVYLAGQTVSSDLKTAGGSILFVDAGFTNILAPGLKDIRVYIPRLYSGVSIYFRPVDKNSRRSSFPRRFSPQKNCGCKDDTTCGPDYGVITKATIWQHLCLNIGISLGAIPNKDFDNFYNNTSLLVGPAYRFKRAFKISAGLVFLKRSSENPIISDKQVIIGQYVGLSVDLDFIQSIKDITSVLFK